jgi:hypothetical protein
MPAPKDPIKYQEWKRKLSEARKKYFQNHPEKKKELSEAFKGDKNPMKRPEVARKLGEKRKGWKPPEKWRKQKSEIMKKNNPMKNPEIREKLREKMKGDKNPAKRPEVREKIKQRIKEAYTNSEVREKLSKALKGKPKSEEHRKKISKAKKGKPSGSKGKHWKIKDTSKMSEAKKGEKNPNYQGGKKFKIYPEKFWELRQAIRTRDHYTCQVCGKYPAFDVHHIDYNKKNCEPENLITLCRSCHSKTQFHKEYWKNYFLQKINEKNK